MAGKVSTASSGSKPEMAGIVAPLDNRFYLFNHFEKPPMDDEAFVGFWMNTAKYVQKQDHLLSMHLHQCIDPESKFQWVNFVVFDSNDVCVFGKPDPEWKRRMQAESDRNMNCYPGQYREISSYNGDAITAALKERPDESRFLLTAVTADDSVSAADLEENWKSWMKTNFIHEQLKGNTNLRDSLLYKMVKGKPFVRYTVRTELSGMSDKDGVELAKLVNEQQKANGVKTFTAFYKIHTNMFYKKE